MAPKPRTPPAVVRRTFEGDVLRWEAERLVRTPVEIAWDVLRDAFAAAAPNLSAVEILSDEGVGMRRRCVDTRGVAWTETCDVWRPGEGFGFRVDTDAPGYPLPVKALFGRFAVEPKPGGCQLSMKFVAEPRGPLSRFMLRVMSGKLERTMIVMLDRWAAQMEEAQATRRAA